MIVAGPTAGAAIKAALARAVHHSTSSRRLRARLMPHWDGSDTFDHFAVRWDTVIGFNQHDIADLEAGAGYRPIGLVGARERLGLALGSS